MAAIYTTLISKINATLQEVIDDGKLKEKFAYPEDKYTKYPVAVFYPDNFENNFDNTSDNFKTYNFKLFLIISLQRKKESQVFETVMPNLIDSVLEKFDAGWNGGTIDGHRYWINIDVGFWDKDLVDKGEIAFTQLNIQIKLLTTN